MIDNNVGKQQNQLQLAYLLVVCSCRALPLHISLYFMLSFYSVVKSQETKKQSSHFNLFSNDGSFLDQFKQLKEKKLDQKLKSFKRDNSQDKIYW